MDGLRYPVPSVLRNVTPAQMPFVRATLELDLFCTSVSVPRGVRRTRLDLKGNLIPLRRAQFHSGFAGLHVVEVIVVIAKILLQL